MEQNEAIIARIRGVKAQPGTPETDADPRNPNARPANDNRDTSWADKSLRQFLNEYHSATCPTCRGSGLVDGRTGFAFDPSA